jgi:hypothetical protein
MARKKITAKAKNRTQQAERKASKMKARAQEAEGLDRIAELESQLSDAMDWISERQDVLASLAKDAAQLRNMADQTKAAAECYQMLMGVDHQATVALIQAERNASVDRAEVAEAETERLKKRLAELTKALHAADKPRPPDWAISWIRKHKEGVHKNALADFATRMIKWVGDSARAQGISFGDDKPVEELEAPEIMENDPA